MTGIKAGTVTITCACGDKKAETTVTVKDKVSESKWNAAFDKLLTMNGTITIECEIGSSVDSEIKLGATKAYEYDKKSPSKTVYYNVSGSNIESYALAAGYNNWAYNTEEKTMAALRTELLEDVSDMLDTEYKRGDTTGTIKELYDQYEYNYKDDTYTISETYRESTNSAIYAITVTFENDNIKSIKIYYVNGQKTDLCTFDYADAAIEIPSDALSVKPAA